MGLLYRSLENYVYLMNWFDFYEFKDFVTINIFFKILYLIAPPLLTT